MHDFKIKFDEVKEKINQFKRIPENERINTEKYVTQNNETVEAEISYF